MLEGVSIMNGRYIRNFVLSLLALLLVFPLEIFEVHAQKQVEVETRTKAILEVNGKRFRDLNNNGELDAYENWELSTDERVNDVLSRMTLEEKVGLLTINEFPEIKNGEVVLPNKFLDQHTEYLMDRRSSSGDRGGT